MHEVRKIEIVKTKIVKITPEMATEMLTKNLDNRKVRPKTVTEYASYMRNGQWIENGETILMSDDGFILNGQHRLSAIVMSNISIKFLIVIVKSKDGKGKLTPMDIIQDRGAVRSHTDISGIDVFGDRVAAAFIRDLLKDGAMLSKNTMLRAAVYECFSDKIDYIHGICTSTLRLYSRVSIYGILTLRLLQGYDHADKYHSILTDLTGLPASWMSWYKKVATITGNGKHERLDLMALTWTLTDPSRDEDKKIVLRNVKKNIEEITMAFLDCAGDTIKKITGIDFEEKKEV